MVPCLATCLSIASLTYRGSGMSRNSPAGRNFSGRSRAKGSTCSFMGLPLALPALIRFQLRQLVRSELAAFDQHVYPRWRDEGLPQEQQTEQLEAILTLTDTLISVMHRRMVYQV